MPPKHRLSTLSKGTPAIVVENLAQGSMRRRLLDIGFTPGAPVQPLFVSLSGGSVAYQIRDSVFALRTSDADSIVVEPQQCKRAALT